MGVFFQQPPVKIQAQRLSLRPIFLQECRDARWAETTTGHLPAMVPKVPFPDSSIFSSENSIIPSWPVLPSGRGEAERGQQGRLGGTCPGVTANNSPVPRRPEAVGVQGDILEGCGSWENMEEGSGEHARDERY